MTAINHPSVVDSQHTCDGCPDQYQGTLTDGRTFYLRYRYGHVSLGVGDGLDEAIRDVDAAYEPLGGSLSGVFDSDEQRDGVFSRLLALRVPVVAGGSA